VTFQPNAVLQTIRIDVVNPQTGKATMIGQGPFVAGTLPMVGDQMEIWTDEFGIWEVMIVGRKWFVTRPEIDPDFAAVLFVVRKEDLPDATPQPG
jgi:hypothetical protein